MLKTKTGFYLRNDKDRDGRCSLTLNVRHRGQVARITTGFRFTGEEWESVSYGLRNQPRSRWTAGMEEVHAFKASYDAALDRLERSLDLEGMTAVELKDRLTEEVTGRRMVKKRNDMFIPFYRTFMDSRDTEGTRRIYLRTLKLISAYDPGCESLNFADVDKEWLTGFDAFLTPTNSPNIRNLHFRNIRAVFNAALGDGLTESYPFRKFKLPKLEETRKRALTLDQVRLLRDCPCEPWMEEYRDMWMLMFYLIGINAADLFTAKPGDLKDGRLTYRRDKTHKLYDIKVEPEAQAIIDRYEGTDWLLSPLDRYRDYRDYLAHMNRALKKIGMTYSPGVPPKGQPLFPGLSSYWARHTWATIASLMDIPMETIGRALGHSWVNKTVTSIYIDFDKRKVDEANRRVIDAIIGKQ